MPFNATVFANAPRSSANEREAVFVKSPFVKLDVASVPPSILIRFNDPE